MAIELSCNSLRLIGSDRKGGIKMFKIKSLLAKIVILGVVVISPFTMSNTAMAATNDAANSDQIITETVTETVAGTVTKGEITPSWLAQGPIVQYPSAGGTWVYGFWVLKVRSYYTVDRCHGSTVKLNGKSFRSVDTAPGKTSLAELWAVQTPGADDEYYYRVCD